MAYFFNASLGYYEGDRLSMSDVEVSQRPGPDHVWENGAWVIPLTDAQAAQAAVIDAACQADIYAGFTSSALGAVYNYPAKDKDQMNLSAAVASAVGNLQVADWLRPFWCADQAGLWAFRSHNAAQIIRVGLDAQAALVEAQAKCADLKVKVAAATTVEAVQAIVW